MRLEEVLPAMREGRWARRAGWGSGMRVRRAPQSDSFEARVGAEGIERAYVRLGAYDTFADDWELVPDEPLPLPAVGDVEAERAIGDAVFRGDPTSSLEQGRLALRALHDYARKKARTSGRHET